MISKKNDDYMKYFPRCTESTKRSNSSRFKKFCLWTKKTPEQLINEYTRAKAINNLDDWERDKANQIIEFYQWFRKELNPKNNELYSSNYCNEVGSVVLSFYHQNCKAIEGVMDSFNPTQIPDDELSFTQELLRKVYFYADLEGQTLLSLATCLGYSSVDFLSLECKKLRNLVQEAEDKNLEFIQFIGSSRAKTSIQPRSHLTPEAIHNLKDYLQILEKKFTKLPKFLWCTNSPDKHITNEGLNKRLRRIIKNANIETYEKKVRFHLFRKFLYTNLQAKNVDIAKVITGKKVSTSNLTYIPNLNAECLRVFKETYKQIALNGDLTGKTKLKQEERINDLENAILTLSKDLQASKTITETLTNKMNEKDDTVNTLTNDVLELQEKLNDLAGYIRNNIEFSGFEEDVKEAMREKYGIRDFSKDEKELMQAYRKISKEFSDEDGRITPEADKEVTRRFQAFLREWMKTHELPHFSKKHLS